MCLFLNTQHTAREKECICVLCEYLCVCHVRVCVMCEYVCESCVCVV